jgi:hypothetical protein
LNLFKKYLLSLGAGLAVFGGALSALADSPSWITMPGNPAYDTAIRQCLQAHPKGPSTPMVENMWPSHRNGIGITTVDLSGRRQSCYVDLTTGKIEEIKPEFEAQGPFFVSAQLHPTPPQGQCIVAKQVVVKGQLRGWLVAQRPPRPGNGPDECSSPVWTDLQ